MQNGPDSKTDSGTFDLFGFEPEVLDSGARLDLKEEEEKDESEAVEAPHERDALAPSAPTFLNQAAAVVAVPSCQGELPSEVMADMTPEQRQRFDEMKRYFAEARRKAAAQYPVFSPKDDPSCYDVKNGYFRVDPKKRF